MQLQVVWLRNSSQLLLWLVHREIHVYVQARNTQEGGAGCDSACRAHSHDPHTGEEAQLSGQTACHLIATEGPAGGGQGQAGGGAQCVPRSPHPWPQDDNR